MYLVHAIGSEDRSRKHRNETQAGIKPGPSDPTWDVMNQSTMHRREPAEHPHVVEAKELARQAGSTDNFLINWALCLLQDRLSFVNGKRT